MQFDWQATAAPAIVLLAIAYLARAFVGKWFRKPKTGASGGCGSCGSCPGGDVGQSRPEVYSIAPIINVGRPAESALTETLPTVTKL